jgi:hypothetical protein
MQGVPARRPLPLAIVATLFAFLAGWAAIPLPHDVRVAAIDVGWLLLSTLCAAATWQASRRPEQRHLRTSLRWFAAGAFVWALGTLVWTYQEVVRGEPSPVFQFADAGFWFSLPLFVVGVLAWPRAPIRWHLGTVLDFSLIGGLVLLFGFEFMVQPLLEQGLDGLGFAYAVLYPPGDIALFGCVFAVLLLDHWRERRRIELIALGFLLIVVADALYTRVAEDYVSASRLSGSPRPRRRRGATARAGSRSGRWRWPRPAPLSRWRSSAWSWRRPAGRRSTPRSGSESSRSSGTPSSGCSTRWRVSAS